MIDFFDTDVSQTAGWFESCPPADSQSVNEPILLLIYS